MSKLDCPSADDLRAFVLGELSVARCDVLFDHLETCARCETLAQQMDQLDDPLIQAIRQAEHLTGAPLAAGNRDTNHAPPHSTPSPEPRGPNEAEGLPECVAGYTLLGELGRGGMGVVYKARQARLGRLVALKMILHGGHAEATALNRFRVEAQAIARLQHPNIVQIHEVGEDDGRPFLSLELCPGGSLRQRLRGTPLPAREAAALVETLARAMQAAHDKNVIHRDLKPANVLFAEDGTPKVSDFGLAKKLDDAGQTATGAILGTPAYMAPEQAAGKSADLSPACDVYALGAILYECLTGRPPFQAATALDTLQQVAHSEPVAPGQLQPKLPQDLDTICLKCLRKEPQARYTSAAALADDLGAFLRGEPIQARPVGRLERVWRWARRRPAAAAACLLGLLLLAGGVAVPMVLAVVEADNTRRVEAEQQKTLSALELAKARERDAKENERKARKAERQAVREAAVSTLERAVQICQEGDTNRGLLWLVRALDLARQAPAEDLEQAVRWNLSAWSREVHALVRVLPHTAVVNAVACSPDGRVVAAGCQDGTVHFWDLASGQAARPPLRHPAAVTALAFRPGESDTLLTGCVDGVARLWSGSGTQPAVQFRHAEQVTRVAFRADGQAVLTASRDRTAQLWQADTGKRIGPPLRHGSEVYGAALSPDGKMVITGGDDWCLRFWQVPSGKLIGDPLVGPGVVNGVSFSPDGKTALICSNESRAAHLLDVATKRPVPPPYQHRDEVRAVAFSPDGKHCLTGGGDQVARLWNLPTSEVLPGGRPLVVPEHPVGCRLPHAGRVLAVAFSPDGRTLLTAGDDRTVRVWRVAAGTQRHMLIQGGIRGVAFSPDSRTMATAGLQGAVLWSTATGKRVGPPLAAPQRIQAVAFSPDGKLVLTGGNDCRARLWNLATRKPAGPEVDHGGEIWSVAFAPNGKTFATGALRWRGGSAMTHAARLWDTATSKPIGAPLQHGGSVRGLAYHPDGHVLLTGSDDGTTRAWDATTAAPLGQPVRHAGGVRALAFSADGRLLATGGLRAGQLWDGLTWKRVGPVLPQEGAIEALAFSRDGLFLLAGGTDAAARLWHTPTGKPVGPPLRHTSHVRGVALSADGRLALTGSEDGTARVWAMPAAFPHEAEAIAVWVQVLTGMELDDTGSVRVLNAASWQQRRARLQEKDRALADGLDSGR